MDRQSQQFKDWLSASEALIAAQKRMLDYVLQGGKAGTEEFRRLSEEIEGVKLLETEARRRLDDAS